MRKLGGPEVKGTDIIETKTQNVNILHPKGYSGQNDTTPRFHSFTIIYHCLVQESQFLQTTQYTENCLVLKLLKHY